MNKITNDKNYNKIIIAGDFNLNFNYELNKSQNNFVVNLNQMFNFYGFKQMVNKITYNSSDSLLDLIFTNREKTIYNLEVVSNISQSCEHKAV